MGRIRQPATLGRILTNNATEIATAILPGPCRRQHRGHGGHRKGIFSWHDEAQATEGKPVLDEVFIVEHTQGFEVFEAKVHSTGWEKIAARLDPDK